MYTSLSSSYSEHILWLISYAIISYHNRVSLLLLLLHTCFARRTSEIRNAFALISIYSECTRPFIIAVIVFTLIVVGKWFDVEIIDYLCTYFLFCSWCHGIHEGIYNYICSPHQYIAHHSCTVCSNIRLGLKHQFYIFQIRWTCISPRPSDSGWYRYEGQLLL